MDLQGISFSCIHKPYLSTELNKFLTHFCKPVYTGAPITFQRNEFIFNVSALSPTDTNINALTNTSNCHRTNANAHFGTAVTAVCFVDDYMRITSINEVDWRVRQKDTYCSSTRLCVTITSHMTSVVMMMAMWRFRGWRSESRNPCRMHIPIIFSSYIKDFMVMADWTSMALQV
jgi:hypothetical protein